MTMDDYNSILPAPKRTPWNKGKLIGESRRCWQGTSGPSAPPVGVIRAAAG
jgi:hypothetical protein